jgi:endonuclease/exonuclease/phosphatase (EEP) superfamily protein YafD
MSSNQINAFGIVNHFWNHLTLSDISLCSVYAFVLIFYYFMLFRWFAFDSDQYLIWSNMFFRILFLPLWPVLIFAWYYNYFELLIFTGIPIVFHLLTMLNQDGLVLVRYYTSQRFLRTDSIKIFSCNLLMVNSTPQGIISEILIHDPDIILFQEYSTRWAEAFQNSDGGSLSQKYCHSVTRIREDSFGTAIFSKLDFEEFERFEVLGTTFTTVVVRFKNCLIRIFNIHPLPPRDEFVGKFQKQMEILISVFKKERMLQVSYNLQQQEALSKSSLNSPPLCQGMIVAGGFNNTQYNKYIQEMTTYVPSLACCHALKGRPFATTFPNGFYRIPEIRIDHAFISTDVLQCESICEGQGLGSDHRPVIFSISVASVAH